MTTKEIAAGLRHAANELDPPPPHLVGWAADTKIVATLLGLIEAHGENAVAVALVAALREAR